VPSHVGIDSDIDIDVPSTTPTNTIRTTTTATSNIKDPSWYAMNRVVHTQQQQQQQKQPSLSLSLGTSHTTLYHKESFRKHRDMVQEAFFNVLDLPIPTTATATATATAASLWSQKYGHAHSVHSIVGASTLQAAKKLSEWIQLWCATRQQALDRMKDRQERLKQHNRKNRTNNKKSSASSMKKSSSIRYKIDSDEDAWDDDEQQLTNVYLLTGPPASGKTGLVHAVAKKCQCSVVEINTTTIRSGSALKHSMQEATQSCSTLHMFQQQRLSVLQQQQQTMQTPHYDCTNVDEDEDNDDTNKTASLTIILIDEVDLIYETEGDSGFWSALSSVAKTARCPILLTANTIPSGMANIKYAHLELNRPSPMDCASKVLQVCQHEKIPMRSDLAATLIPERLSWMATVCQCDLRKLLNQLQLFAASKMHPNSERDPSGSSSCSKPSLFPSSAMLTPPSPNPVRPIVNSIVPHRIPADKYTIVTLYGSGFATFGTVTVQLGDETTLRAHIADNERLLILCPPCRDLDSPSSRVRSVLISSSNFGDFYTARVTQNILFDGSTIPVLKPLFIEYLLAEEREEMEDSEEQEFDDDVMARSETKARREVEVPTLDDGLGLWEETLAYEQTMPPRSKVDHESTYPRDGESAIKVLEDMAKAYEYSSDAAFLEDFQHGIPHLAGACRGFGFDLTEEGGGFGNTGKLRLNENSRP
jgi:DNA polymerase III delta prime subunit